MPDTTSNATNIPSGLHPGPIISCEFTRDSVKCDQTGGEFSGLPSFQGLECRETELYSDKEFFQRVAGRAPPQDSRFERWALLCMSDRVVFECDIKYNTPVLCSWWR